MTTELLDLEHTIDWELVELYEILEYNGVIDSPSFQNVIIQSRGLNPPALFIPRASWGARGWRSRTTLKTAQGNTAHYEGPRMGVFPHTSCATKVRGIQAYHMDQQGWADIAYSDVVCPHGYIFEGRWYGYRTAANGTEAGNDKSYAHCVLIGEGDAFPVEAQRGLKNVTEWFEQRGSGTRRWVHGDWKATACPGPLVTAFVRNGMQISEPTPPPPPPGPQISLLTSEDAMPWNTYEVIVGTGADGPWAGFGWVRLPWTKSQIKGVVPPGLRPEVDQRYLNAKVGFANDDRVMNNGTVMSVEGWAPGFPAHVQVTVSE